MYPSENRRLRSMESWTIPTTEDKLDVFFDSIIATCRSVVFGTVQPRSWDDISSTWYRKLDPVQIRKIKPPRAYVSRDKNPDRILKKQMRYKEYRAKLHGPRKPTMGEQSRLNKMIYILQSSGMDETTACMKACEILSGSITQQKETN